MAVTLNIHSVLCGDGLQMSILSFKEDKAREVVG